MEHLHTSKEEGQAQVVKWGSEDNCMRWPKGKNACDQARVAREACFIARNSETVQE